MLWLLTTDDGLLPLVFYSQYFWTCQLVQYAKLAMEILEFRLLQIFKSRTRASNMLGINSADWLLHKTES